MCQCFTACLRARVECAAELFSCRLAALDGATFIIPYLMYWHMAYFSTKSNANTSARRRHIFGLARNFMHFLPSVFGWGDSMDWCRIVGMCLLSISLNICVTRRIHESWKVIFLHCFHSLLRRQQSGSTLAWLPSLFCPEDVEGAVIPKPHFNIFRIHFLFISSEFVVLNNSKNFSHSLSLLVSPGASHNFRLVAMTSNL